MDIEIRRNRDLNFRFELSKEQRESLLDLFKPKVVDEWVEEMLNENKATVIKVLFSSKTLKNALWLAPS